MSGCASGWAVDLHEELFVRAEALEIARRIAEPADWRRWWPDLKLAVYDDRAATGLRWTVSGALHGSQEIWLQPWGRGVLVHYFLRADHAAAGTPAPRGGGDQRRVRARRMLFEVKMCFDAHRAPGLAAGD